MRLVRKARFIWVYPLVAWFFLTSHTSERSLVFGAIIVLLGETWRMWANGYVGHVKVNATQKGSHDQKIGRLITGGPYAYVRHPLYFGTFLIGVGFCVVAQSVWLAVVALGCFLVTYRRKMTEEEVLIREEWGSKFERYQCAVPRWLPNGRRYDQPTGQWSWQGIVASKEFKTLIWSLVLLIVLYFHEEWLEHRASWWQMHSAKHTVLIVAMASLVLSDLLYELVHRARRHRAPLATVSPS